MNLKNKILLKPPKNGKFYLLAIDGRGGSGKSSLTDYLATILPAFLFLNGDDYFEPTPGEMTWGSFNEQRFADEVISQLAQIKTEIVYRPYDWHKSPHISEQVIKITHGVCVERCFSFGFELDYDLKIWVETPKNVCLARGLARDKSLPNAGKVWCEIWQPREDNYIKNIIPLAEVDIIVDGEIPFSTQIN